MNTLLHHVVAVGWDAGSLIVKSKEGDSYDFIKSGVDGDGYALIKLKTGMRAWYANLKALHRKHPETRDIQVKPLDQYYWHAIPQKQGSSNGDHVITSQVFTDMVISHH